MLLYIKKVSSIDAKTVYVKKLCSLNPTRFEYIPIEKAVEQYKKYVCLYYTRTEFGLSKDFNQWLKTEI